MNKNPYSDNEEEEKQAKLDEANGEDSSEDEHDEVEEEEKDLLDEWFDEVEERYDRIEERFGDRRDVEIIKKEAIRPFFYFKDDRSEEGEENEEEEPITDKQKSYLQDLADKSSKRFFKFVNNEEDIESVGPPEEIIENLTKAQASEVIDFLNQTKDYEDYKEVKED